MSIDSAAPGLASRLEYFESALERALADAKRWEFDLPSDGGLARARELFAGLAAAFEDVSGFDVDVAVDGAIGLTVGNATVSVSLTVAPDGSRLDAGTVDHQARTVVWTAANPEVREVIREIHRAA